MTGMGGPVAGLARLADLTDLARVDVDPAHLNRAGPVLRERALFATVGLVESERGALTTAATAAVGERIDTDAGRRLDLALLAERPRRPSVRRPG